MKNATVLICCLCGLLLASCNQSADGPLFNGKDVDNWEVKGEASVADQTLTLSGAGTEMLLKSGKYKDFKLSMEVLTTPGGKGAVAFHTDNGLKKGYRVAINNDRRDKTWWKMTGSLLYVRNLTKSFVKEDTWFKMDIIAEGNTVTVNINGAPVVEYTQPAEPYRTRTDVESLLGEGTFALLSEGTGKIQFKSITVQSLKPEQREALVEKQLAEATDENTDQIIRLHQQDFPVLDYHVHLKGGLTPESAARQSRKYGINYAIAPNCGIGFPITNDQQVMEFLNKMRGEPFILAMQAEGREWIDTFSPEVRAEFDYVFTDALTFTDDKDRRSQIWIPQRTWIDNDEQKYMDMIVDRICKVLEEPMDIYVNPCFIPDQMNDRYDAFWTEARMNKFVEALAKSGKALEINNRYKIPNKAIILKAKQAGVKFTFGTNNAEAEFGKLEYCIRMKEECGLTAADMYKPKIKI